MNLSIPPPSEPLFDWALTPVAVAGQKGLGDDQASLSRDNRVQIGAPQVYDLREYLGEKKVGPEYQLLSAADFLLIRLACSFAPDRRSRYLWARFSVELRSGGEQPIAFDSYPKSVTRELKVKRGFEIAPTLKLAFADVSVKGTSEEETIDYAPQVSMGGLLTSAPSWTFETADRSGLVGSREMYLVVKLPRTAQCFARFDVSAEAQGRLGPIPLRRSQEHVGEPELVPLRQ